MGAVRSMPFCYMSLLFLLVNSSCFGFFVTTPKLPERFPRMHDNAVYFSAGAGRLQGTNYYSGTIFYERFLQKKVKESKVYPYLHVGAGLAVDWGGAEGLFTTRFGVVSGVKPSRFELNGGAAYVNELMISGSIGYRYQKPNGKFIFRAGIARFEGFYLSIGNNF
jgi:hypothetical protein